MAQPAYEHNRMGITGGANNIVTEAQLLGTNAWTITVPVGFTAAAINIEVSNSRSLDPTQPRRNIHPRDLAFASSQGVGNVSLSAGVVDPGFEASWVVLGNLSSSAYTGSSNFRWIRLKTTVPANKMTTSFEAYLWRSHDTAMV